MGVLGKIDEMPRQTAGVREVARHVVDPVATTITDTDPLLLPVLLGIVTDGLDEDRELIFVEFGAGDTLDSLEMPRQLTNVPPQLTIYRHIDRETIHVMNADVGRMASHTASLGLRVEQGAQFYLDGIYYKLNIILYKYTLAG